ncbi:hypothetical protein [Phytohabitans houttuyneae]|uniref:Uncharacterized protein n=1 Tax=Phytohabitans houttuyneae TaxID=1076126 RepID=A0A6V8K9Q6_9ACTN|nr:hypothetical protein [Phytohabitans houttuyneae]GFJ81953.1 hypothetical protein Phou_061330 [Phytohabitans houttuyneae]
MKLDTPAKAAFDTFGGRFLLVGYLPTYAGVLSILILFWAGAPGKLNFSQAWHTAVQLGLGELLLVVLAVMLTAAVLQPLHLRMIRVLEGDWPTWAGWLARLCTRRQRRCHARLARAAMAPPNGATDTDIQRAGQAGALLVARFPPSRLRPTALGNALAAMEARAGAEYGWDATVAWPRLYPVLGPQARTLVDDRRNTLDLTARLTVTATVLAVVTAGLLAQSRWWVLLALAPLALAVLAYRSAVQAAIAYGETVGAAFDLHRFDLLEHLHLPLPADQAAEQAANEKLCLMWRQGAPTNLVYRHQPINESG